jgi:two-component system sensor histidine kinase RegB
MPPPTFSPALEPVSADTLRQLVIIRAILLTAAAAAILMAASGFRAQLPLAAMLAVLLLHGGLLAFTAWQARRHIEAAAAEVFVQLAADAAAIAALVYFSGGYANPFISLLLVPLVLSAVALGKGHVWAMTFWVATLYSLLARYYQPLRLDVSSQEAIDLHLIGMWLNFLLTAVLVAAFVARLAAALRAREAELARLREQALRDEHLFGLGMQAAAAAHDLSTPLSGLMVAVKELQRDYAGDDELGPELARMGQQVERMKAVLGRLAAAAGAARTPADTAQPLDAWLRETFAHWQLMRPQAQASLELIGPQPAPTIRVEPLLISVLATLLNNAADAAPAGIEMQADWQGDLRVEVRDRGPGLQAAGDKPGGWGVGLTLARAALERFGGRLDMAPRAGGGLRVTLNLPLARLQA